MELRRRKRSSCSEPCSPDSFLDALAGCRNLVVFTGSGLSASSGMSMFSTRNGLYDRARKKFKIQDGIKLFTYSFYKQRRAEVQAFFAQIYSEAQGSQAAPGHHALAALTELGCLHRHYTLNIDGLAEAVGISTWHHEKNPSGVTVEMHGNIRQLVCPSCHAVEPLTRCHITTMRGLQPVNCKACKQDTLRFKIMLYDDDQGDCITPEHVFETLEEDLEVADAVLWIGISFEQSASTEYFRRVRSMLSSLERLDKVKQVVINPSEDAYFNIISSMCNVEDLQVMDVRGQADTLLPLLADRIKAVKSGQPISRTPTPAPAPVNGALHATSSNDESRGVDSGRSGPSGRGRGRGHSLSATARRRVKGGISATDDYVYDHDSEYDLDPHEVIAERQRQCAAAKLQEQQVQSCPSTSVKASQNGDLMSSIMQQLAAAKQQLAQQCSEEKDATGSRAQKVKVEEGADHQRQVSANTATAPARLMPVKQEEPKHSQKGTQHQRGASHFVLYPPGEDPVTETGAPPHRTGLALTASSSDDSGHRTVPIQPISNSGKPVSVSMAALEMLLSQAAQSPLSEAALQEVSCVLPSIAMQSAPGQPVKETSPGLQPLEQHAQALLQGMHNVHPDPGQSAAVFVLPKPLAGVHTTVGISTSACATVQSALLRSTGAASIIGSTIQMERQGDVLQQRTGVSMNQLANFLTAQRASNAAPIKSTFPVPI